MYAAVAAVAATVADAQHLLRFLQPEPHMPTLCICIALVASRGGMLASCASCARWRAHD